VTAAIIFSIWLSWELLELLSRITGRNPLDYAAPFAGLACAAFGLFYF
jgi:hypothetical protein